MISIDLTGVYPFVNPGEPQRTAVTAAKRALELLESGEGAGGRYTDWYHLPERRDGLAEIKAEARRIKDMSDTLVVVGVGGSYLGARAVTELLLPQFGRRNLELIFAGKDLSARRTAELLNYLRGREFSVNVISKSGTTTEPAVAFRLLLELLEEKYGAEAPERVIATADGERGALLSMAKGRGWRRFVIPSGVGGRYSVLTPVGLLPIEAVGLDAEALLEGALEEKKALASLGADSPELLYAAARRLLCSAGYKTELLSLWEPSMRWLGEWYKQLFGESEGKEGRGIFPASLELTADLHSMGQYIQQGPRNMLETMLYVEDGGPSLKVPELRCGPDGLECLAGMELSEINHRARAAVAQAHGDGGVPVLQLSMERLDERCVGELIWFFETACGISAYMDGVNPFNQPGVEAYKVNMYRLFGKPYC